MKQFKDFKIQKQKKDVWLGDSIPVEKLINKKITIHRYKITDSKFGGDCLYLQVELNGFMYVVFTGAENLMFEIKQIPEFPFETTISNQNGYLEFD